MYNHNNDNKYKNYYNNFLKKDLLKMCSARHNKNIIVIKTLTKENIS